MKKKNTQQKKVELFFDKISSKYQQKYDKSNIFLSYFFNQRITEATKFLELENKSILDIGAGTGALYHFLKKDLTSFEYFATDISANMLAHSGIPEEKKFIGKVDDFPLENKNYDYIFLLGVTTYFSEADLEKHLILIQQYMKKDSLAILSFTNKKSLDFLFRGVFQRLAFFFNTKRNVIGQDFDIHAYSLKEVSQLTSSSFGIQKITFLNQTIPPFSRLFPRTSIKVGNFLTERFSSSKLLSIFSSDFLIFLKKK